MYELEVDIQTADGLMNTFITRPEDDRVYPMVLFLMDALESEKSCMTWRGE